MKSIAECLAWGSAQLIDDAQFEAMLLLAHVLQCDRLQLIKWPEKILLENEISLYQTLIHQRKQGKPIAYILGHREFWTSDFQVTSDTLIPRPETELLIEQALAHLPQSSLTIGDIGTGSGIIACTLAKERPDWKVIATDVSQKAIEVAKANSQHLGLSNVQFVCTHWCEGLIPQSFDAIISNPPYIAENDPYLVQGDLRFEPRSALVAGPTGLEAYQVLIPLSKKYLKIGGLLGFEHGFDQAEKIREIMHHHGFIPIATVNDLASHPRVTLGVLPSLT